MELWVLGAGAIVLVGIALWIVWPASSGESSDAALHGPEASQQPMAEPVRSAIVPGSDRFTDQYTSATADLSAEGTVAAFGDGENTPRPAAHAPEPGAVRSTLSQPDSGRSAHPRRRLGLGASVILAVGGGVGGAWLYARWQRERNRPINRLRRGARGMTGRVSGAVLVAGGAYVLWRTLRRGQPDRSTQSVG